MSIQNGYCTLAELLATKSITSVNTTDDTVIENLITSVSRFIDQKTRRVFYPYIQTKYFDTPLTEPTILKVNDDLLEITTLTNGDTTVITSTYYRTIPYTAYPKHAIELKGSSPYYFTTDADNDPHAAISILGLWGFHEHYDTRGWLAITTLAEAVDISETAIDLTSATGLGSGALWKVDSEILQTASVATNTATVVKRGDNGSTAATHDNGATVYLWQPQDDIKQVCLELTTSLYETRYGQGRSGASEITAAGIVITPRDVTEFSRVVLNSLQRITV